MKRRKVVDETAVPGGGAWRDGRKQAVRPMFEGPTSELVVVTAVKCHLHAWVTMFNVCSMFVCVRAQGALHRAPMNRFALALVCSVALVSSACGAPVADEDAEQTSSELGAKLSAAELAATKQALRTLANANMGRTDNAAFVRSQAQPLVDKLARHFGTRRATQKLPLVEGAWRQLWTDYPFPMTSFISMDASQVYQVVDGSGHYWNIGDQKAIGFIGMTGVLRGSFTPSGTKINLEFTNVGFRFGRLSKNEDLVTMSDELESGERFYWSLPGGGKAPNGPVGIKGTLETLYVDADFRVDQGTQQDVLDANGNVAVPGYGPKLFVLDRVSKPVKQ